MGGVIDICALVTTQVPQVPKTKNEQTKSYFIFYQQTIIYHIQGRRKQNKSGAALVGILVLGVKGCGGKSDAPRIGAGRISTAGMLESGAAKAAPSHPVLTPLFMTITETIVIVLRSS